MTALEQANKHIQGLLDKYDALRQTRGTWYLWEFRDKRAEVTALLAKALETNSSNAS